MKTSHPARAVARDVGVLVGKGKKVNIGKLALKHGYSASSAKASKPQRTKAYKDEMQTTMMPLVMSLEAERLAIIKRLKVVRNKARYRDLIDGLDKITKNLQLLTGGATENIAMGVAELSNAELERLVAAANKQG